MKGMGQTRVTVVSVLVRCGQQIESNILYQLTWLTYLPMSQDTSAALVVTVRC